AAAGEDTQQLRKSLELSAERSRKEAEKSLLGRGEEEAKAFEKALIQQQKHINDRLAEIGAHAERPRQLLIADGWTPEEARQHESDARALREWRDRVIGQLEVVPDRIKTAYQPRVPRIEPLGL